MFIPAMAVGLSSFPVGAGATRGASAVGVDTRPTARSGALEQFGAPSNTPTENPEPRTYVVVRGDTLWWIARDHGVSLQSLVQANGLSTTVIYPGQRLTIPTGSTPPPPSASASAPDVTQAAGEYVVVRGDTLWRIARDHGVSLQSLVRANGLTTTVIYPGQRLTIPTGSTPATPSPGASAPVETPASAPTSSRRLMIPSIGLDEPVRVGGQGTIDAGYVTNYNGCWPGQNCTVWLAGHRTTHGGVFGNLGNAVGAEVVLVVGGTQFRYTVVGRREASRYSNPASVIYGDMVLQTSKSNDVVFLYDAVRKN